MIAFDVMTRPRKSDAFAVHVKAFVDQKEFERRLAYVEKSYDFCNSNFTQGRTLNAGIKSLKSMAGQNAVHVEDLAALPLELQLQVQTWAQAIAKQRGEADCESSVHVLRKAAAATAQQYKPTKRAPFDTIFDRHMRALISLAQDEAGEPVMAVTQRSGITHYEFTNAAGRRFEELARRLHPDVRTSRLVNLAKKVRKEAKGRRLNFHAVMPGYRKSLEVGGPPDGDGATYFIFRHL